MHFPIRSGGARARGLDYLAIGDTHGYRVVESDPPVVYPGSPEPTAFDEIDPGHVVLVQFLRTRGRPPNLRKVRVARWRWHAAIIRDLASLQALAAEDLRTTVLRIAFDLEIDLRERDEIEAILATFAGDNARAGTVGVLDADRSGIRVRVGSLAQAFPPNLSPVLQAVVTRLQGLASGEDGPATRRARLALYQLSTLTQPRSGH
jgi:DNA repair exonuclease SbcCD nuclease subunit